MTRRDLLWRSGGLIAFASAGAIGLANRPDTSGALGLFCFALAMFGAVLIIQGRRVPAALRIECSRHRELPRAIHARRCRPGDAND